MAELSSMKVTLDASQVREAIRNALPSTEDLARELHDVVFTFGKPIPVFDKLQPQTQAWFRARAEKMLGMFSGSEGE